MDFLQDVVDQAQAELGEDKSMSKVEIYINQMDNMELLGLIDRALGKEKDD